MKILHLDDEKTWHKVLQWILMDRNYDMKCIRKDWRPDVFLADMIRLLNNSALNIAIK